MPLGLLSRATAWPWIRNLFGFFYFVAAHVANAQTPALVQNQAVLGAISLPDQIQQTPQGPIKFASREVDIVRSETPAGCRLALSITNNATSPKLHVVVDGQLVQGFDDVAWHSLVFTPNGKHLAFVANQNGKQTVVIDGHAGPLFERIGREGTDSGTAILFTPDSRHFAYAGGSGKEWIVICDGKPWRTIPLYSGPTFSPGGRHLMGLAEPKEGQFQPVIDGTSGEPTDSFWDLIYSPDDRRYAYVSNQQETARAVIDGNPDPLYRSVGNPVFSPDSKHVAYIAGQEGKAQQVVRDGIPGSPIYSIIQGSLQFTPDSQHVLYTAFKNEHEEVTMLDDTPVSDDLGAPTYSPDGKHVLYYTNNGIVLDGAAGPRLANRVDHLIFSPDNRQVAYLAATGLFKKQVVTGNQLGPPFDDIDPATLTFSPDSRHLGYVATLEKQRHAVIDQKTGPAFDKIAKNQPIFSADSSHYAYAGESGQKWQVVLDGVAGPAFYNVDLDSLKFSPDGRRLAYAALDGYQQCVVVNTTPGPKFDQVRPDSVVFSPDSQHLAYIAKSADNKWQVVMDGTAGPKYDNIGSDNLVFSSDGRHSAYVAEKDGVQQVVLDGEAGPAFDNIVVGPIECRDGRLEYLAYAGDRTAPKLVRVTVPGFGPAKT